MDAHEGSEALTPKFTIQHAKMRIMESVPYVRKTGRFKSAKINYAYAGERDLISKVRPAMLENNVHCTPTAMCVSAGVLVATYRFTHAPSMTFEDVQVLGEIDAAGGKGPYKAMTGAMKYAIRQWLMIETGDDPDKSPKQVISPALSAAIESIRQASSPAQMDKVRSRIERSQNLSEDQKTKLLGMCDEQAVGLHHAVYR